MKNYNHLLIGNSFPLSLIVRRVVIEPISLDEFRRFAGGKVIHSFWGHSNTLAAAGAECKVDLTPREERAVVTVSPEGFPVFDGMTFGVCFLISPFYCRNFRPAVGEEVPAEMIKDWQILKLIWSEDKDEKI
ncbi:MAG: hypothetical protein RRY34_05210 [Victivallaceae bacterium]